MDVEERSVVRLRACRACREAFLQGRREQHEHHLHHEREQSRAREEAKVSSQRSRALPLDHYDHNGHFSLLSSQHNKRDPPVAARVHGDSQAYFHLQRKIAGLLHLYTQDDLPPNFAYNTQGERFVGTAELLTRDRRGQPAPRHQLPLRHAESPADGMHTTLPDGFTWSHNGAALSGHTPRQHFQHSLARLYDCLYTRSLQEDLWRRSDLVAREKGPSRGRE